MAFVGTQREPVLLIPQLCYMTGTDGLQPFFKLSS